MNSADAPSALDGLLDPLSLCLDAESARRVVELRADPAVQARVDELAERANEGLLTAEERADDEAILDAADFIAILKLKARRRLGRDGAWRWTPSRANSSGPPAETSRAGLADAYERSARVP